jgi:hypothetical protein
MAYVGNNLTVQQYAPQIAYFSGNASTTAFTLPQAVVSSAQILVFVANVPQNPSSAYTVSGTTLTFTSAPPTGTNNVWVEYTSLQTNTIAPSAGTVQTSSFGSVTSIPFTGYNSIGTGNSSVMKNRIINGAMVIDQRNAGATFGTSINGYTVDRFAAYVSITGKINGGQNYNSVTPPTGFSNYLGFQSQSAYSISSTDYFIIRQNIEGFNSADLAWGTANAKTVTLSFWVYSSLTGTFGGSLLNSAQNYSYPFSYSIPTANTWTNISVTIAGPTAGTWVGATNGIGIIVNLGMGVGTTLSGTAGAWASANYTSATGATSVVGTNNATFYITGVQLEVGLAATGFEYRQYGTELSLCQRYACSTFPIGTAWGQNVGNAGAFGSFDSGSAGFGTSVSFRLPVPMRATPTATTYNPAATNSSGRDVSSGTDVALSASPLGWGSNNYAFVFNGGTAGHTLSVHISLNAEL